MELNLVVVITGFHLTSNHQSFKHPHLSYLLAFLTTLSTFKV